MKTKRTTRIMNWTSLTSLAVALFTASQALAQLPAGSPTSMNAAFLKLFGSASAFTAKADVQVLDGAQQEWVRMPVTLAALDNKARLELDMNKIKMQGKDLPAEATASFEQMGMNRVVSIIRPDKKATYVIYPGAESYLNVPLSKAEAAGMEPDLKLEKTEQGKESIDGHACIKNKVVIKGKDGQVLEATTWNASDLKDFPVQIQARQNENTVVLKFSEIKFSKLEASQFELPAGYTGYSDQQSMFMGVMKKKMGGAPK